MVESSALLDPDDSGIRRIGLRLNFKETTKKWNEDHVKIIPNRFVEFSDFDIIWVSAQ